MKKILVITFLIISGAWLKANAQIYVSPDGDDSNPGTIDKPIKSIGFAIRKAYPDTTIYLRGGVYYLTTTLHTSRDGTSGHYIKLSAYPGEHPILDFSKQSYSTSSRGLELSNDYWYLKGITIRYAGDNGIHVSGGYNIVEDCIFYGNKDTGLQISNGGHDNYIHDCDSYKNYDSATHGENADGFACKLNNGAGNKFVGCRSYANADDGWDFYESQYATILDSCWAFSNGYNIWNDSDYQGDGNGFKVGGNYVAASHIVTNCVAFYNKGKGFDQNHNTAGVKIFNCTGYHNGKNFSFPEKPVTGVDSLVNDLSYDAGISIKGGAIQESDSWNGFDVSASDFISLDTSLATAPRMANGSLPNNGLLHLAKGSLLIDAGIDVGLTFSGKAPDIGAFEYGNAITSIGKVSDYTPAEFSLEQNYPNPFNPTTNIAFQIPEKSMVSLEVYNILGQPVETLVHEVRPPGHYMIKFDGSGLASGVYIYRIRAGSFTQTRKFMLLK